MTTILTHRVSEIFGRKVGIGKLYIDVETESSEDDIIYAVKILSNKKEVQEYINSGMDGCWKLNKRIFFEKGPAVVIFKYSKKEKTASIENCIKYIADIVASLTVVRDIIFETFGIRGIYLPAARTGLLMLYREFFANRVDNTHVKMIYDETKGKFVEYNPSSGNLTKPVYDFLRFLQTFSEEDMYVEKYRGELEFFEKYIISGHLETSKRGQFTYNPTNSEMSLPLYLTSSMINEVVPILLAITCNEGYKRVIIDEVEASLHPEKQLELVRFLNRLCNKGMQFIISTHSDTFVSKLNNLYILSHNVKDNEEILKKLNLDSEDLVDTGHLHIYEFINQDNGMSLVKEVSGDPKRGFQFDLFTGTAMKLYDETLMVEGLTGK